MRLLPTDDQVKTVIAGLKRHIWPVVIICGSIALLREWSHLHMLLMFLSIMAASIMAFSFLVSEQHGKGILPDFHLKPFLDKAQEQPLPAALVVLGFFGMLCWFLSIAAGLIR